MMLYLQKFDLLRAGIKVLHFAPEKGLSKVIAKAVGSDAYHPRDFNPERYKYVRGIQRFDLCSDSFRLPSNHYDVIMHSHVLEHVPCNYGAVLLNLQRALAPDGVHICSIPVLPGRYDETTQVIGDDEAVRRFGQYDHVRRFGADDLQNSLGMFVSLPDEYDLLGVFTEDQLRAASVPPYAWRDWTPHSVLALRKSSTRIASLGGPHP